MLFPACRHQSQAAPCTSTVRSLQELVRRITYVAAAAATFATRFETRRQLCSDMCRVCTTSAQLYRCVTFSALLKRHLENLNMVRCVAGSVEPMQHSLRGGRDERRSLRRRQRLRAAHHTAEVDVRYIDLLRRNCSNGGVPRVSECLSCAESVRSGMCCVDCGSGCTMSIAFAMVQTGRS
jgi:hypothetical protein